MLVLLKQLKEKFSKSLKFKIVSIAILVLYIVFILGCTIKVDKEIITPGVLNNPSEFITIGDIENNEITYDKGNINTIGVYVTYRPTLFQYLISQNNTFSIYDYDLSSDLSPKDQYLRGKELKMLSIESAIITAYTKASNIDSNIKIDYDFKGLIVSANLPTSYTKDVMIGDIIIGVEVDENYYPLTNDVSYLVSLINDCFNSNEEFKFRILRGEETLTIPFKWNESGSLGLEIKPKYEIKSTYPTYIIDNDTVFNSTGSSGGMMLTLSIYNSLLPTDYTKGLIICGTGTVDDLGNVGAIGGIRQKITTSQLYKADIFFCPYSDDQSSSEYQNYLDALDEYNKIKNPTFKLIKVKSFDDILSALESYGE